MPHYKAYGLRIESDFDLPELIPAPPADHSADINFRRTHINRYEAAAADSDPLPNTIGLHYPRVASMLVANGTDVDIDPHVEADPRVLRLILLGPVLGLLLHQRGYLVLHASAVELGSTCIAFIGEKGAGKSTTAAAFNAHGHPLVADDVLAVSPGSHLVYPGFPQLKLWREAADHLAAGRDDLPALHPDLDKVGLRVASRFAKSPLPLSRVYSLAEGPSLAIESLAPALAFMELVKHSYALPFVQPTGTSESHFRQAVDLAARITIRRLVRPRSLPQLSQLIAAVVADAP